MNFVDIDMVFSMLECEFRTYVDAMDSKTEDQTVEVACIMDEMEKELHKTVSERVASKVLERFNKLPGSKVSLDECTIQKLITAMFLVREGY